MDFNKLIKTNIKCFCCQNAYNCKYFKNPLWDSYMFSNPEDGCPAEKYPFESIVYAIKEYKKRNVVSVGFNNFLSW